MPKKKVNPASKPAYSNSQSLRQHLLDLLSGGNAHATFDDIVKDLPANLRGSKAANLPHTPWMLLEHLRVAQEDILDFSRNPHYKSREWPKEYWPETEAPPDDKAWDDSVRQFHADLKAMQDLVAEEKTDLFAKIPWGDGQTILREALLVADHNAYHLGQFLDLRRALGAWKR
jgi:DinB superfamily